MMNNNRGNTLVMVLVAAGLVSGLGLLAMRVNSNLVTDVSRSKSSESVESLVQTISLIVSDNALCTSGVDGSGPNPGLVFEDASGNPSGFNSALASSATGQNIRLGTNLNAGTVVLRTGLVLDRFDLRIDQLVLRSSGAIITGKPLNTYSGEIFMTATQVSTGRAMAMRKVTDLTFHVDPATSALLGCAGFISAQQICEDMGCSYLVSAENKKCQCLMPNMTCPADQYISGYDAGFSPICRPFELTCETGGAGRGPGYFMAGIDRNGAPICVAMVKLLICEGGSTPTPSLVQASPPGCYCTASQSWNGTACVALPPTPPPPALVCTGGATTTASAIPASPAGCFCAAGQSWDGANCIVVPPTPPTPTGCYNSFDVIFAYNSDCLGYYDDIRFTCPTGQGASQNVFGTSASPAHCGSIPSGPPWITSECRVCTSTPPPPPPPPPPAVVCAGGATTTVSTVPASPVGCYCAAGQTWNGSACVAGGCPPGKCCFRHPMAWTHNGQAWQSGAGTGCAEAGSFSDDLVPMDDGEQRSFTNGICTNGSPCHGRLTIRCNGATGGIVYVGRTCQPGDWP